MCECLLKKLHFLFCVGSPGSFCCQNCFMSPTTFITSLVKSDSINTSDCSIFLQHITALLEKQCFFHLFIHLRLIFGLLLISFFFFLLLISKGLQYHSLHLLFLSTQELWDCENILFCLSLYSRFIILPLHSSRETRFIILPLHISTETVWKLPVYHNTFNISKFLNSRDHIALLLKSES